MRDIVEARRRRRTRSSRSAGGGDGSVITGFARLDGWPVALLASDPYHYGGAWTADASRKIRRHVDLAQTFHLPVVHLVDVPGIMVGLEAEQKGTIRFAAEAIAAIMGSTMPWCAVIVRKCYGIGGGAHAQQLALRCALCVAVGELGLDADRGRPGSVLPLGDRRAPTIRKPSSPRSRRGCSGCARRSAPRKRSTSTRSSIRATRGGCCANS